MLQRLRDYFRLAAIVGTLPADIQDGQLIDANPVMDNFNFIASQINANVPPLIPSLTALVTFTPGIAFSGASVGVTYASRVGSYVKIGTMVFFAIDITLTSKGSSVGDFTITGLPFTISSNWLNVGAGQCALLPTNVTFTNGIVGYLQRNTTSISVVNIISGSPPAIVQNTAVVNTSGIAVSGFYSV